MATAAAPVEERPTRTPPGATHRGPPLGPLAVACVGLFVGSFVVMALLTGGAAYPTPYDPPEAARAFFGPYADALQIVAFLQFGSAIPLGLFTATIVSRLRFLGLNVAGVSIALFGGFAAALMLAISALVSWTLAQPGIADDPGGLRILQLLTFAFGGPGHVVPLGLLLAGVSVPAAFARLLPRWLVWFGLIVAVIAELSWLSLIAPVAGPLLPIARFPALLWLTIAGFMLPTARGAARKS
jgi:hypothetical protein